MKEEDTAHGTEKNLFERAVGTVADSVFSHPSGVLVCGRDRISATPAHENRSLTSSSIMGWWNNGI